MKKKIIPYSAMLEANLRSLSDFYEFADGWSLAKSINARRLHFQGKWDEGFSAFLETQGLRIVPIEQDLNISNATLDVSARVNEAMNRTEPSTGKVTPD